jgi:hypothetical protein
MFPMRQSSHLRLQSQQSVSLQESNGVAAQDVRYWYPAMSILYTQPTLQDPKLASYTVKGARGKVSFDSQKDK